MNTILINCSKDKAVVSDNNGRFLNRVANGIKIEVGDEISVEQIAINSIGVGSDIIEIPNQQLNYKYATNQFALKTAFYIHQNYKFTCNMPLALKGGGDNMGNIGIAVGGTNVERESYGFLNGTPTQAFIDIIPRWNKREIVQTQSGIRYYLVDKQEDTEGGATDFPSNKWYNMVEAEVPVEVDTGYDNPSNVAAKVSEDLKSIDVHPLYNNSRVNPNPVPPAIETANTNNGAVGANQVSISSRNGLVQTRSVNFTNNSYTNPSRLYSAIATTNPWLWVYGSRLINDEKITLIPGLGKKNKDAIINLAFQTLIPNNLNVMNLYDIERSIVGIGTNNQWNDGYVITTNLDYNISNVEVIAKFIRSQQQYETTGNKATSVDYINEVPGVKDNIRWSFRLGRTNDYLIPTTFTTYPGGLWSPHSWNAAAVPIPTLAAPIPAGASNPPNSNITSLNAYFNQELWDKRYLGQSEFGNAAPNQSINTTRPYKPSLDDASTPNLIVDGIGEFDPYGIARYFDINICAVKVSGKNADGSPGIPDTYNIGFIMNARTLGTPVAPLGISRAGNYCLIDLGMTQNNNFCVELLNPNTQVVQENIAAAAPDVYTPANVVVQYINEIQVGSPNALLFFDGGRGRFGFQDLHWKLYTGNGYFATTAATPPDLNAAASVAINSYNRIIDHFINPALLDAATQNEYYPYTEYLYAESGIGLLDMGLYPTSPSNIINAPAIDYLDLMNKREREIAFEGSLLRRFGFEYKLLFNVLGLPCILFNSKYYDNNIPTTFVQLYPSPLTTNPLIDTAIALNFGNNANGQPNFDLNTLNGWKNINASSQSSTIYASNLPQKLVFPFWLIHSDLIGGIEFHSENQGSTSNIIAICNRSYTSGDFAYSFATDYTFTATKEYVVSGITTQILNPDLTPADINERTSIVYKIQKRIPMFEAPKILPNKKDPKDFTDKAAKDRARNDDTAMPSIFSLT
jgi:hypothetical protein